MRNLGIAAVCTFALSLACAADDQPAPFTVEIGAQNPQIEPNEPPHDVVYDRNGDLYFEPVSQETDDLWSAVLDHQDLFPENRPMPMLPEIVYPLIDEKLAALRDGRPIEVEKWHSALYHGVTGNGNVCYVPASNNIPCYFPRQKNQLIIQGAGNSKPFKCSAASLAAGDANEVKMPKALADVFMDQALFAMTLQDRPNIGMLVRTSFNQGTLSTPTGIWCSAAQPDKLGSTTLYLEDDTCQAGLPAHGGVNPTCARQTTDAETVFYPARLYKKLVTSTANNGCNKTPASVTSAVIQGYARFAGVHEWLHSIGFGHFTTGVMKPTMACSSFVDNGQNSTIALMSQPFVDAMAIYSGGHENDDGILHDTGLGGPNISPFQHAGASEDTTVLNH